MHTLSTSPAAPATARSAFRPLRRHAVVALAALAMVGASAGAAGAPSFDVVRDGAAVTVRASAVVRADRETVWRTLVDYPRLPDFIPDMQSSTLLSREGDDAVVRQSGRAGLGPFSKTFGLTLAVREVPLHEVSARALDGDFERFESRYVIAPSTHDGATRVDYVALMAPRGGIPPLVGLPIMRAAMQRQFEALLAEMDRRGRSAAPAPAGE